jgi:hypothetical protein
VESNGAPRKGNPGWSASLLQLNDPVSVSATEQDIEFHASMLLKSLDVVERQENVVKGTLELDKARFADLLCWGPGASEVTALSFNRYHV